MNLPEITSINFHPCVPRNGLIGFVDFVYDNNLKIQGAAVHTHFNDLNQYRLVYPNNMADGRNSIFPIQRDISKHIDAKITEFVNEQLKNEVQSEKR